jgi:hypothetical protein
MAVPPPASGDPGPRPPGTGGERGQSEVLGFVLSFSIILLSVGLVYSVGFGAVTSLQEGEQVDSAERAMVALGGTFENLQRGDPARASEIRLAGGRIAVSEESAIRVTVTNASGYTETFVADTDELVYTYEDASITYEAGAVFRRDGTGGGLVSREPVLLCSPRRAVVSVVTIDNGARSLGGDGSATVTVRRNETRLLYPTNDSARADRADRVALDVTSPHEDLWDRYFSEHPNWASTGPGQAECVTNRVYVRELVVRVNFIR